MANGQLKYQWAMALDGQWVSQDPTRRWARGPANFLVVLIFASYMFLC